MFESGKMIQMIIIIRWTNINYVFLILWLNNQNLFCNIVSTNYAKAGDKE